MKKTTFSDVLSAMYSDYSNGTIGGISADGNINFQVDVERNTKVANLKVGQLDIQSGTNTINVNAANVSSESNNGFGNATVNTTSNTDYVHDLGFSFAAKTPNIKSIITSLVNNEKPADLITASSHFTWTSDTTVTSDVSKVAKTK